MSERRLEHDRQLDVGNDAREQLLAWIPRTDQRLELAGVSTAMLESSDGLPDVLAVLHGPGSSRRRRRG
jgi:hypothetical protein